MNYTDHMKFFKSAGIVTVVLVVFLSNSQKAFATNSAPVLDASRSPVLSSVVEDAGAPTGSVGTLVSSLVDFTVPAGQVDNVTDSDGGALLGIAITAVDPSLSCYYSINSGATWLALGSVSEASARLLAANGTSQIYCAGAPDVSGSVASAITFRAWDQTSGTNGGTDDTTSSGGTTAFSGVTDTAGLLITAINNAPIAVDDSYTMPQNASTTSMAVLDNDTDDDGDLLTITDVTPDVGTTGSRSHG